MRSRTGVATTFGYGPRYLHSTGQYHKGGPPNGLFFQVVADGPGDVAIPGAGTFGQLKRAQADGDSADVARATALHTSSARWQPSDLDAGSAFVGLGRMGGNMARRLRRGGRELAAWNLEGDVTAALAKETGLARATKRSRISSHGSRRRASCGSCSRPAT